MAGRPQRSPPTSTGSYNQEPRSGRQHGQRSPPTSTGYYPEQMSHRPRQSPPTSTGTYNQGPMPTQQRRSPHTSTGSYNPAELGLPPAMIPRRGPPSMSSLTGSQVSYPGSQHTYPGLHHRGPYANGTDNIHGSATTVGLEKKVGLVSGTALIVGTMIGSGIFISPTGVTEGAGSVGLSLIVWLVCGIISLLGALSYAELGTLITKSGAEYSYLLESFGPLQRHVGPLAAFLFNWVNMVLLKPASVAIIALAFAIYVLEPFFDICTQPAIATRCLAILVVLVLTLINCLSVRAATIVQNVLTVVKLVAIAVIVIGGLVMLCLGHTQHLAMGFAGTETNIGNIAIAFYNGMWAYDGWNNLNYVTEEIINPYRNLPRAILIGIPLVTVCYLLVNVSYFTVMSVDEILESPAVAITWGNRSLGVMYWLIPLFVACSTFGAANGTLFTTGRLSYVAAREGHMVELLSMIHIKRLTPLPSLVFTAIMASIFILPGNIASLIQFFSFAVWFFYGLAMVAFLILRYTMRDVERPVKIPIFIPIIVLVVALLLVIVPIATKPHVAFLYAFLFIMAGILFYIPFVVFAHKTVPVMSKVIDPVTSFFQCLMEVSKPTEDDPDETAMHMEQSTNNNSK